MRAVGVVGSVVCASLLALVACSGGDDDPLVLPTSTGGSTPSPTVTEPTPTTATPTAEPTPTTTLVLPDEHVPEVDEFVRQFFAAYNAAQDSGDFTAFDAMYLPQCSGCIQMRDELKGWLADGGTIEGADWAVVQQSSASLASNFTATAIVYRIDGQVTSTSGAQTSVEGTLAMQANFFVTTEPSLMIADLALIGAQ